MNEKAQEQVRLAIKSGIDAWARNYQDDALEGLSLTDLVEEIRKRYAKGAADQPTLARAFGVTQAQISKIVLRRSWRAP